MADNRRSKKAHMGNRNTVDNRRIRRTRRTRRTRRSHQTMHSLKAHRLSHQ